MPHDPRIFQERVLPSEDVIVGAADADMADGDAHPARRRGRHRRAFNDLQATGLRAEDGFHVIFRMLSGLGA
ncbi:hypothetical protein D3C72_1894080 [compost metagenome]